MRADGHRFGLIDSASDAEALSRPIQRRTTYKVSFLGGRVPLDLRFGVPSRPNLSSGALKSALPGPREGSSILNSHLVVMSAAVPSPVWSPRLFSSEFASRGPSPRTCKRGNAHDKTHAHEASTPGPAVPASASGYNSSDEFPDGFPKARVFRSGIFALGFVFE